MEAVTLLLGATVQGIQAIPSITRRVSTLVIDPDDDTFEALHQD